jgi:hypothetical protein
MKMIKLVLSALILTLIMSFAPMGEHKPGNKHIVLVLKSPMDQESFSVFDIRQVGDVLVATNIEDYPVVGGLYRIEGSSNDKFYHKKIIVLGE